MYVSSTAVVFAELFKLFACLVILLVQHKGKVKVWGWYLYESIIGNPVDTLKLAVPSFIYVVQNNLQYVAISHLDVATFQVGRKNVLKHEMEEIQLFLKCIVVKIL